MTSDVPLTSFADLDLPEPLHRALADVGYETPSAIQARTIPLLLTGADMVGQAQTGTGKTAAFALPCLANLNLGDKRPQVMVLAPTRELAIQVAEAFQNYARYLPGFHVLPVYGGSDMRTQLRQLQRGVHVIVGTPGRVMDHMRRKSLDLSALRTLVLDEADEMLRMGFIDDVEWILEQTPPERQIALFSATMPDAIRRIAKRHLRNPEEVTVKVTSVARASIRQRVWMMAGMHKLDALTRILETEDYDGIIIFVRTRIATTELADKLAARGFATAALNGDVPQKLREKTVEGLKKGRLDILVATDVAARGLDVDRISHVINYDIPNDVEAYVHRIGRTGRAGRHGEAILFAANRERRLLQAIERATGNIIEKMTLPTAEDVSNKRRARFMQRITETLDTRDLQDMRTLVESYQHEFGVPVIDIAAALALLVQGQPPIGKKAANEEDATPARSSHGGSAPRERDRPKKSADGKRKTAAPRSLDAGSPDAGMTRYRIDVGHEHDVKPGNIVGAIANEADIDAEYIGRIVINEDHSTVDLPEGMPKEVFRHLKSVWVCGRKLNITALGGDTEKPRSAPAKSKKRKDNAGKGSSGKAFADKAAAGKSKAKAGKGRKAKP